MISISRAELRELYLEKELSTVKIAKLFDCGKTTIYKKLKKFDIPIRNRSEAKKGRKNPMYGRKHTDKTKEKMRERHVGFKGKKHKKKIRVKLSEMNTGNKNPNWRGGIKKKIWSRVNSSKWRRFRKGLLKERGEKCQRCGNINCKLDVAHILHPEYFPDFYEELTYFKGNILVLCKSCHGKIDSSNIKKKILGVII